MLNAKCIFQMCIIEFVKYYSISCIEINQKLNNTIYLDEVYK